MERLFYEYNFEQQHAALFREEEEEDQPREQQVADGLMYPDKPLPQTSSLNDFAAPLTAPLDMVEPSGYPDFADGYGP